MGAGRKRSDRAIIDSLNKPARTACCLIVVHTLTTTALAQPSVLGQWSSPFTWGTGSGGESVHAFMLPTGNVMYWQYSNSSVRLWNPTTGQFSSAPRPQPQSGSDAHNPFCAGHAWLPDGRLLVVGGQLSSNALGSRRVNIYNPFTNTWSNNVPSMPPVPNNPPTGFTYAAGAGGRWYPSVTTLGNGDVLVMSGSLEIDTGTFNVENPMPQVYETATNTWRDLTSAYRRMPLYPRTFLMPDGRVANLTGNGSRSEFINPEGTGQWSSYTAPTIGTGLANYGSAVMYDTGKVAHFGGRDSPIANISLMDLNQPNPVWAPAAQNLAHPRRQHDATLLADGTVFIVGGSSASGFNNYNGRIRTPEIWDPLTQQVAQMAAASDTYRGYHSTSLLLPDGRVLVAGGTYQLDGNSFGNTTAEIYSPPYLFKGARPTVLSAPARAPLGSSMFVATPDAADIMGVNFIIPGAVTHGQDWTQRMNRLDFTQVTGGLSISLPENPNAMPPNYYMMFLVNSQGVPSIAEWVQVVAALPGDFNGDGLVDAADYVLWRKTGGPPTQYDQWRANFGIGAATAAGSGASAPDEPGPSLPPYNPSGRACPRGNPVCTCNRSPGNDTSVPEPGSAVIVITIVLLCMMRQAAAGRATGRRPPSRGSRRSPRPA